MLIGDFFIHTNGKKHLFVEDRIEYVFDLEKKQLSPNIPVDNQRFYPFVNCKNCSLDTLYQLLFVKTDYYAEKLSVDYLAESKEYILFRFRPPIIESLFGGKNKQKSQGKYFVYDKINKGAFDLPGMEKYTTLGRHKLAQYRFTKQNGIMFMDIDDKKRVIRFYLLTFAKI